MTRNPRTPAEWQDAVDWAETLLRLDNARQYGLITYDGTIDVEHCREILDRGCARGIISTEAGVEARIAALVDDSVVKGT
jgi:hypothetical protein